MRTLWVLQFHLQNPPDLARRASPRAAKPLRARSPSGRVRVGGMGRRCARSSGFCSSQASSSPCGSSSCGSSTATTPGRDAADIRPARALWHIGRLGVLDRPDTPCGRCRVLATKTRAGRPEGERGRHKDAGVLREHVRRASHPHSGGRHRRRFRACGPSGAAACGAGPDVLGTGAQAGGARARRAFMLTVLRDT